MKMKLTCCIKFVGKKYSFFSTGHFDAEMSIVEVQKTQRKMLHFYLYFWR